MPVSDSPPRSKKLRRNRRQTPKTPGSSRAQSESKQLAEPDVTGRPQGRIPGGDFSQSTFERHAALLGNDRMSQPSNTLHRSMIVRQIQPGLRQQLRATTN